MKPITIFLVKVLVKQFYIINAGFFLFLFFLFFGVVNGGTLITYHQSLILGMLGSPIFMAVVWAAWLLYNVKCFLFCTSTIKTAESIYLFSLKAISKVNQLLLYGFICTLLYLPVLLYAVFVVYMAIKKSMLLTALLVSVYQLLMITISTIVVYNAINHNNITNRFKKILDAVTAAYSIPIGYKGFLTAHIFHSKKMAFAVVKIFSILLLSVSFIRNGDSFDADFFSIFFQLILTAHAMLVFYCVHFSETQLQFSRNLPLALPAIASIYLFTYCILLLPELVFMLINNHGNLPIMHIIILYGTAAATLFLYTGMLYASGLNMERFMFLVFISFIMIFFLQKSGHHFVTLLAIISLAAAVFKSHYYLFEKE